MIDTTRSDDVVTGGRSSLYTPDPLDRICLDNDDEDIGDNAEYDDTSPRRCSRPQATDDLVLQKMIGLSNLSSQCVDRCGRLYQRRRVGWGVSVDII